MVYEVKGKVFFVTGAATGIGEQIVRALVAEDAKSVIIFDINERDGVALQNELNSKYGEKVEFIKGDVSNEDQFVASIEAVNAAQGLDVLINNAGIMNDSWEKYRKQIDINVGALVTGSLHALKMMRKDEGGKGGTIINLASVAALTQEPSFSVYSATKSAVLQFSNCLGSDSYYPRTGVRVIAVCPGVTDTALLTNMCIFDKVIEDNIQKVVDKFPSQKPECVARALVEAYKMGNSGSTWMATSGRPGEDVTKNVNEGYGVMSRGVFD